MDTQKASALFMRWTVLAGPLAHDFPWCWSDFSAATDAPLRYPIDAAGSGFVGGCRCVWGELDAVLG